MDMMRRPDLELTQRDWWVVLGATGIAVFGGILVHAGLFDSVDAFPLGLTVLAIGGSLSFIDKARQELDSDTARNLEIMGVGLTLYFGSYGLSYQWSRLPEAQQAWLGFAPNAWAAMFDLFTVATFAIIAYGFYRFWEMGQD